MLLYEVLDGKICDIGECLNLYPFSVVVNDKEDEPFTFFVCGQKWSNYVHPPFGERPWRGYFMQKFCWGQNVISMSLEILTLF